MAGIGFVATDTRDAEIVAYEFGQRALRVKLEVGRRKERPHDVGIVFRLSDACDAGELVC